MHARRMEVARNRALVHSALDIGDLLSGRPAGPQLAVETHTQIRQHPIVAGHEFERAGRAGELEAALGRVHIHVEMLAGEHRIEQ